MSIQRFPAVNNSSGGSGGLQGTWNASTNTPALANTDNGKTGVMYQVSVGGTVDFGAGNIVFGAKDIVVNNGVNWDKIDASDEVVSVNGNNGVVVLDQDDIGDGTTNKAFTATEKTKLTGIEAGADVTDSANVDSAGAVMNSDTSTASMSFVVDEDNMASNSATKVPTQQSVKAYADTKGGGTVQDPTTKAIKVKTEVGTAGNARGTNAVDLQVDRVSATQVASGTGSFSAGRSCTASGQYSTASGNYSTASGNYSTANGQYSTASGSNSTASGYNSTASGYTSTASGYISTASGNYTTASGANSTAYLTGQFANSSERITTDGDSQYSFFVVREKTTNATPKVLTLGADGATLIPAILPSGKTWRFVIELVAKNTSNGDTFAATYVGAIKRVGSTTSLVGSVTERDKVNDAGASTWSVAVTADDTNESLKIAVTGEAAKTINWCAVTHLTEVE